MKYYFRYLNYYQSIFKKLTLCQIIKKIKEKILNFINYKIEKIIYKLSPLYISDGDLLQASIEFSTLDEMISFIRGDRPSFLIDPYIKEELCSLIQRQFPQVKKEILEEAEKICLHVFDLLGSGPVNLDEFIEKNGGKRACGYLPWHFDFKVGHRFNPKKYYKEIKPAYGKADIKVPWELSRFQHIVPLGQAYWLTGDERYAKEFVCQIDDWIERNPPKFGVNWTCTMDVSIRVANWILGFYFFKNSKAATDDFLKKFLKSILIHGRHIIANLENKGITNNHYLANLVGLIYLGVAFPEFKESRGWLKFGLNELIKEMDQQVYNDGMDFEASTCYHRLALELFFYPALLCQLNGIELPEKFIAKLKKMFDFVLYVLKPNGRMPQIGDNDSGRLHILGKRDILDMTYLLTFGSIFYRDSTYKIKEFGFAPEALWIFGTEGYEIWSKLSDRSVEELESKAFIDGGIYIIRNKKDYMIISCGPNGQGGLYGHAHNDKLSFELCIDGEEVIVDPGTYLYTFSPKRRNLFRSSYYHNTLIILDKINKQLNEPKNMVFKLYEEAIGKIILHINNKDKELYILKSNIKDKTNITFFRKFIYFKYNKTFQITDLIKINGRDKDVFLRIHLSPYLKVFSNSNKILIKKGSRHILSINLFYEAFYKRKRYWYSKYYGKKIISDCFELYPEIFYCNENFIFKKSCIEFIKL